MSMRLKQTHKSKPDWFNLDTLQHSQCKLLEIAKEKKKGKVKDKYERNI